MPRGTIGEPDRLRSDLRDAHRHALLRGGPTRRRHSGAAVACALLLGAWVIVPHPGALATSVAAGHGRRTRTEVHRSEYVPVPGARLYLLVRGEDARAPVLLWLHGGPGGAERPLFRYFNGDLERHFVVAYWDQRGAGRSFDPDADPAQLTVARHLADLDLVVDHLRRSLGADRVILVGHSWGAALGLLYAQDHADKVSAVAAVNPLVSRKAAEASEYAFVLREAARRGDRDVLRAAREAGPPPFATGREALAFEKLVQRYGGIYHQAPHRWWILFRAIVTGFVTLPEIPPIIRGNDVSLEAMNDELLGLDLRTAVRRVDVPVAFLLGRYDRHVDATLSASYFEELRAASKLLVWFEASAHNIPFEEAERFNAVVIEAFGGIGSHSRDEG